MKRFTFVLVAALAALALAGCDLFGNAFTKVDEVKPSDLASYAVGTPLADSKEEVLASLEALGRAVFYAAEDVMPEGEMRAFARALEIGFRGSELVRKLFDPSGALSRKVTITDDSDKTNLDLTIAVTDEVLADPDEDGNITINSFNLTVTGKDSSTDTKMSMDMQFDADASISAAKFDFYDYDTEEPAFQLTDAQINFLGSGDLDLEKTETTTVSYKFDIGLKAGYTISAAADSGYTGGKFIVEFGYKASEDIDMDDLEDPDAITDQIDAKLTIKVYNNSNVLQESFEYTAGDFAEMGGEYFM